MLRVQCLSLQIPSQLRKRERQFVVDSGAPFHMMGESDLTPEEPEMSRKSEDPPVIMTTNCMIHTTERATEYVYDFVQVQIYLLKNIRFSH